MVRYNGGPQAAHNVVTPQALHHTFSSFGSGTLAGAHTYLGPHVLVDLVSMKKEALVLEEKGLSIADLYDNTFVHPDCGVILPYHIAVNRAKEDRRGASRHGSCGRGIGEARVDQLAGRGLRFGDLMAGVRYNRVLDIITAIHQRYEREGYEFDWTPNEIFEQLYNLWWPRVERWQDIAAKHDRVVFEGAQGFLLDERYGFHPHTTWSDCTFNKALTMCDLVGVGTDHRTKLGLVRSYYTRHGAGPFPTESKLIDLSEPHNEPEKLAGSQTYMGSWRQGHFDAVLLRYACETMRPDYLVMTHMDRVPTKSVCYAYGGAAAFNTRTRSSRTNWALHASPQFRQVGGRLEDWVEKIKDVPKVLFTQHGQTYQETSEYRYGLKEAA